MPRDRSPAPDETEAAQAREAGAVVSDDARAADAGHAACARSAALTPGSLLALQRTVGNAAIGALLVQRQHVATPPPMLSSYSRATDIPSYIDLVREVERQFPDKNPIEILALLRQAYYGKPWSIDTTPQWSDVIPVGPNPGDPRSRIGSGPGSLFQALKDSQEVGGTDMGHIFAGLQAFFHQTTDVALSMEIFGQQVIVRTVNMPNTEFATWGGDVGAAAARPVINDELGRPAKSDAQCFTDEAPDQDLEGNLDAYAMVKGGGGAKGLEAMLQSPGTTAPGTPVSQVLFEYFLGSGKLAGARATKHRDFVTGIGGVIAGNKIANRAALIAALTPRLLDFADMFFWGKYKAANGSAQTAAYMAVAADVITVKLTAKTLVALGLFMDWLEARL
jgi:hypothetical protein